MKTVLRVLRNGSRNQSTADYSRQQLFISGDRYYESIIKNPEAEDILIESGLLVMRDATDTTKILPITTVGDLPKVIGISFVNGEVTLAQNEETNINYAYTSEIDGEYLVLPSGVTVATLVGDKSLKDLLTGLGFTIFNVTENSKFDN